MIGIVFGLWTFGLEQKMSKIWAIDIRRGHFEIFGLDFTENETAVLNVFQDLKSKISEKSDQN